MNNLRYILYASFYVPNFHAPIRKVHCFNFKIIGENFGYTNIFSLRKSLLANVKTICTLGTAGLLSASKYSPQYRRPRVSGVGHNSRSMEITRSFFRGGCQRVKWGEKWETERLRRHFVRKARGAREKGMRSAFAQVTTRFSLHLSRSSPFPVSFFFISAWLFYRRHTGTTRKVTCAITFMYS